MTPGVGLKTWESIGSLNRELRPYTEYLRRGWNVKILTFDKGPIPDLPEGIGVVRFPNRHMLWLLPWARKELGNWADVIKTNQSHHAYLYTRAAKYWGKPVYLRCGYVHGEYLETTGASSLRTKLYQHLEAKAFREASHCQVPTIDLLEWVRTSYCIPAEKISVVPNFVSTDIFKPIPEITKKPKTVVSVGRLTTVKRFDLLIKACADISGCELTLVGEGPEKSNLEQMAKRLGLKLTLPGNIPNEALPKIIQKHMVFGITSEREGHPKALTEAMACGMPVLGVRTIGIQNIIMHEENGWLAESDREAITKGLSALFKNPELCARLSDAAREYVLLHYDFSSCFSMEFNNMESIVKGDMPAGSKASDSL